MPQKEIERSLEDCLLEFAKADDRVVRDALAAGHDLRDFSVQVKDELTEAHKEAVKDCIANADQLTELHNQIVSCDSVFERLEKMLISFQNDLGAISDDMKRLQDQSVSIHQELDNRQKVRAELSQFVDDIVVPQGMIKTIMECDPSDITYLEQLHELQHKLQFIRSQEYQEARAVNDVAGILESLKYKAIEKIREWILQKIYLFRRALSNYQVPQHQLLKYRFFYEFLLVNENNIAAEIQEEYIDTIGKVFFSYFKAYISRLFKLLMVDSATKDDLLGAEDVVKMSTLGGLFSSKPQVRNRATVFSLGSRHLMLTDEFDAKLIVPHVSQEQQVKYQFESLFRSIHLAFVDHCSHEFMFVADFFGMQKQDTVELHAKIMSRAVTLLIRSLDERIAFNFDAISLYLCICLCDKFQSLLGDRGVPSMIGYWDTIRLQLWIRFEQVMNMHNTSVKTLDVKKMSSPIDTRPHYIIRRYAELTCAFLVITETNGKEIDSRLLKALETCEDAVEQLLNRMAATLSNQRDQLVFLINNYHMIINIIDEKVVQDSRIHSIIHELEQKAIGEFVEATLSPHFKQLISFVKACEPLIQNGHTHLLGRDYQDKLAVVVQSFSTNWKKSIDEINGEIVKSFTDFKHGTNILQSAFTQLVQYVQRFTKIVSHEVFRDNQAKNGMVNIHHIMVELKKYKPVY
ncbi:unnamed protein product [Auanema sp. JU1783]|nr:unnamed protein product [Auanema sp. JU1783]